MSNGHLESGGAVSAAAGLAEAFDELTSRLQAGEAVGREEVRRRYPEHAEELLGLLPALAALGDLPGSGGPVASGGRDGGPVPEVLGDFRLLREIGRGGMGVVYEAEQLSLRRRVALKVLPFAGMLDPRQLQRFHNEAQAAACLHHTNIVPVYFVGNERGVHFYAMQFIEGQTLAALIHQLKGPAGKGGPPTGAADERTTAYALPDGAGAVAADTKSAVKQATLLTGGSTRGREHFRRVAGLGVQAAEALDHAHQAGIVHRDVKPANLMVDGRGNLWVADFGLAHIQHGEASVTATGDLVGTLRYMSPEQALAKRVPIDHRTDVYSLGATLYELLTLRPVFGGNDRQELLRQVAFDEPQSPRKLNKAIPAELETIVLKALEKSPEERYATAQEMADDLRRFLDDKPIRARQPSWRQMAAKWARRHRAVVNLAALALLIVSAVSATSFWIIWRQLKELETAYGDKDAAYTQAVSAQGLAKDRAELARQAADDLYADVAQHWLADQPRLEPVQRKFLEKALAIYETLDTEGSSNPKNTFKTIMAWQHLGEIQRQLGNHERAIAAYRRGIELLQKLSSDFPENAAYRQQLAALYTRMGAVWSTMDRFTESEQACRQGLTIALELNSARPTDLENLRILAICQGNLGACLQDANKPGEARAAYQEGLRVGRELCQRSADPQDRSRLAAALHNLALTSREWGKVQSLLQEAIEHQAAYLQARPRFYQARVFMWKHHHSLGWALDNLGDGGKAEKTFQQAVQLADRLGQDFPNTLEIQSFQMSSWTSLGRLQRKMGKAKEAEMAFQRAFALQRKLASDPYVLPHQLSKVGWALHSLADFARARHEPSLAPGVTFSLPYASPGSLQEARQLYRQAIHFQRQALKVNPHNAGYRERLGSHYLGLCFSLCQLHDHAEIARLASAYLKEFRSLSARDYHYSASFLRVGVSAVEVSRQEGEISEAREKKLIHHSTNQTRSLLQKALQKTSPTLENRRELASIKEFIAVCLIDHPRVPEDLQEAVALAEQAVSEGDPAGWQNLCTLGRAYYHAGRWKEAAAALEKSMKLPQGNNPWNRLILSMARWKLEEKDKARSLYRSTTDLMGQGMAHNPELSRWADQAATMMSLEKLNRLSPEGLVRKRISDVEDLLANRPADPDYHGALGGHLNDLGVVLLLKQENYAEARKLFERAIRHQRIALAAVPDHPKYGKFLRNHYANLTWALLKSGDHVAAAQAALKLAPVSRDPLWGPWDSFSLLGRCREVAAQDAKLSPPEKQKAVDAYTRQRRELLRKFVGQKSGDPDLVGRFARVLAVAQSPRQRDPLLAVEFARKAVALRPEEGEPLTVLGMALHAHEEWQEAIGALNKSLPLQKGGTSYEFFFLAMAHWQLGEKDKARAWYDKAVSWMNNNRPEDEDLRRFRDEAAELLGVQGSSLIKEG